MVYWEIIAVSSQIHTKHINTLYGQNAGFFNLHQGVCTSGQLTTGHVGQTVVTASGTARTIWRASLLKRDLFFVFANKARM